MLRQAGRKIIIRSSIALAYIFAGITSIFQLPLWVIILIGIVTSIFSSFVRIDPFTWDKLALQLFYTPETTTQAMHTAHMFGDPLTAEQIYVQTLPFKQQDYIKIQLRSAAYPQEKLEQLRSYWSSLLTQQPSSREAFAALTAVHQSLHEVDAMNSTLETWMFIEPNDPRIPRVTLFTK